MEKKSKKSILIGVTSLFLVILILVGLTYAYYRTRIIGNNATDPSISVQSKKIEITYQNESPVVSVKDVVPGYSITKTFEVKNTGSETANYSIVFDKIDNTFIRTEDWTFSLKKGETEIESGIISSDSYQMVVGKATVAANTTDYYTLIINYADLEYVDQTDDMLSHLSLRINIAESVTLMTAILDNNEIEEPISEPGKASPSFVGYKTELLAEETESNKLIPLRKNKVYTYSDVYDFDEKTGKFELVNPQSGKYVDVYKDLKNKYVVSINGSSAAETATGLSTIYYITNTGEPTVAPITITYKEFATPVRISSEAVLAETEDDYGTSYYFRGSVENNFVNYSGMCWRIVRIDGNGNVKLVLADENNECNSNEYSIFKKSINTTASWFSGTVSDPSVLMFENSNMPSMLDTWSNRTDKKLDMSEIVTDAKWCNDVSILDEVIWDSSGNIIDGSDTSVISMVETYYSAFNRLAKGNENTGPTLKCNMTGINNSESKIYVGPIALLTADELSFAGQIAGNNSLTYLTDNQQDNYFTMTPYNFQAGYNGNSSYYYLFGSKLDISSGYGTMRPAILLKSSAVVTTSQDIEKYGESGTKSNPYIVVK